MSESPLSALSRTTVLVCGIGMLAVVFVVYGWSLTFPFVRWDDGLLVYDNPVIRAITPATLRAIFTNYDPELYIPLTFLSYQLNYVVGGIHPGIYHLTNALLHATNAFLVGVLLFQVTERRFAALIGALLFAVHPLHTETVVWISARKDLLATCFCLLSMVAYFHGRSEEKRWWYVVSLLLFACALLSKVVVVTMPILLLILHWLRRDRMNNSLLHDLIPYVGLSIVFGLVALGGKQESLQGGAFLQFLLLSCKSTAVALGSFIAPIRLSVLYPHTTPITIAAIDILLSIAVVFLLTAALAFSVRRTRLFAAGIFFFLVAFSPSFVTFFKGGDVYFFSDRYAYLPSIGLIVILAVILDTWREESSQKRSWATTASTFLILVLGAGAIAQSSTWRSSEALFAHAVAAYPNAHRAWNNLGNIRRQRGDLPGAEEALRTALAIQSHPRTRSNLGAVLRQQERFAEAREEYDAALASDPDSKEAHFGLGILLAQQNDLGGAIVEYERAIAIDPTYAEVRINLGSLLLRLGRLDEAIAQLDEAVRTMPFSPQAHYNRGVALATARRMAESLQSFERAVQIDPTFVAARINLAIAYMERRRLDDARQQLTAATSLDPDNERARQAMDVLQELEAKERRR